MRSNGASTSSGLRWHFASDVVRQESRVIVTIRGRIGYAAGGALGDVLADVLDGGPAVAIVDLSAVDYVSGEEQVGWLSWRQAASSGGRLVLCGLQDPVRQVLSYVGVLRAATVETTREDALKHPV